MKKENVNLLIDANFYGPTGFGKYSSQYIIHLARLGINVQWKTGMGIKDLRFFSPSNQKELWKAYGNVIQSPRIRIHISTPIPGMLFPDINYDYNIAYTVSETETIAPEMVNACLPFNELWVPTEYVWNAFAQGGFPENKMRLIPYGVDIELFNPAGKIANILDDKFIFFAVSGWGIRKGWDLLIQAYSEEFSPEDNVCLFIKTGNYSHDGPPEKIRNEIKLFQEKYGCKSPIVVTTDILNDHVMAVLYRSSNCFVLPTRGEGFGIPFLEAMATGLPTIFTDYGGMKDFARKENAFPIEVDKIDVYPPADNLYRYYKGHHFAYPNLESLKKQMRFVYQNYDEAKKTATRGRMNVLTSWTWQKVCTIAADRLVEIQKDLNFQKKNEIRN